jgi:AraC-like DNA-binding protein
VRFSIYSDGDGEYLLADDRDIPPQVRPFIVERDLAGLAAVLTGANVTIAADWLETTLDEDRSRRLAATWSLTTDVRPNRPGNRIVGRPGLLDVPLPQADPNTARVAERQCRKLLEQRLSRVGVAGQVRSRLMHTGRFPTMQEVADELHLDPRTLRRRLTAEGTSYRDLIAQARRSRAEQLLSGDEAIEAIAAHLGYAETASFTHAFTRWTGMPPSHFRARSRG